MSRWFCCGRVQHDSVRETKAVVVADALAAWERSAVHLTPPPGDGTELRPYTFVTGVTEHALCRMYDAEIREQASRQGLHDPHAIGHIVRSAACMRGLHPIHPATGEYHGPIAREGLYPNVSAPTLWYSVIVVPQEGRPPNVIYMSDIQRGEARSSAPSGHAWCQRV